jgi:hypothetical protein
MGIKKYLIASIILLSIFTGYIYTLNLGDYTLNIAYIEKAFTLPIFLWIMLPAVSLLIATIVHIMYYSFKNYLNIRCIQKDSENLLSLINKRLLGEKSNINFKLNEFKVIGDIITQLNIKISDSNFSINNTKILKTAENIMNIKAGKYVSNRDLKLPNDNPLMENNIKNRIDIDNNIALEIIEKSDLYTKNVLRYAFIEVTKTKSMTTIKKILDNLTLDLDMLQALIKKDSATHDEFSLENNKLIKLINAVDVTNSDLIKIAKNYKESRSPEQLMKLFEDLTTNNEKLTESYLYVLTEYQMIDDIREILINSQTNEFLIYKAYLDLRDAGKHYSLDNLLK